ncbi:MAG: hypothetical protein IK106_04225 [Clostridiales bacterium]|nr:hypothetical protein [Clostridiales bacterium]
MTLVKVHTCSKCGGTLKVNDDLQKYECPFCGISYEYEYFQKKVILEMAESSLHAGDFPFAEKRYLFALKKQPHDARLLQGRILSHAKLDRVEKTLSIPDLIGVDYPNVERAMKGAEENAFPEDKEYFGTLHDAFRAAEELEAIKKRRSELENEIDVDSKSIEFSKDNNLFRAILETIGNAFHTLFFGSDIVDATLLRFVCFAYVILSSGVVLIVMDPDEGSDIREILKVLLPLLLIPVLAVLILNIHLDRRDMREKKRNIKANTAELEKVVAEDESKEKELASIIERLEEMDLSRPEEETSFDEKSYKENLKEIVTCPSCDGELIDNRSRALYECPFCGLTFDYEYVRHDRVLDQAEKALLNELYHEAGLYFAHAEETRPNDFRVLRGYVLSEMKVPKTPAIRLEYNQTSEGLENLRMRVDSVIKKAQPGDKEYFEKISELADIYEEQLRLQRKVEGPMQKIHEMRRREFSYKTRGPVTKPNGGKTWSKTYRVPKEKLPEERETVELANEQNRALKTRVLEIRTAMVEIEKAHGLPKDLLI